MDNLDRSSKLKHADVTDLILKAFFDVYNDLGYGFLERVYANAISIAARKLGLDVVRHPPIHVHFRGEVVGEYVADLLVNQLVLVELKATRTLADELSCLIYLKATPYEVGLLLNFGPRPQFKRRVFENTRKGSLSWHVPFRQDADPRG
jgi:GxxExxY protein